MERPDKRSHPSISPGFLQNGKIAKDMNFKKAHKSWNVVVRKELKRGLTRLIRTHLPIRKLLAGDGAAFKRLWMTRRERRRGSSAGGLRELGQ